MIVSPPLPSSQLHLQPLWTRPCTQAVSSTRNVPQVFQWRPHSPAGTRSCCQASCDSAPQSDARRILLTSHCSVPSTGHDIGYLAEALGRFLDEPLPGQCVQSCPSLLPLGRSICAAKQTAFVQRFPACTSLVHSKCKKISNFQASSVWLQWYSMQIFSCASAQ